MLINIRRAGVEDSQVLTDLAIGSEGYWGYDAEFMESFKSTYKVTPEFINRNPNYIMEDCGNIVGFYGIVIGEEETSLEYFYIESSSIGKGYGKIMWNHTLNTLRELAVKEFMIVTSPQAGEFYTKMGAGFVGEVESLVVKGRKIPKFNYMIG